MYRRIRGIIACSIEGHRRILHYFYFGHESVVVGLKRSQAIQIRKRTQRGVGVGSVDRAIRIHASTAIDAKDLSVAISIEEGPTLRVFFKTSVNLAFPRNPHFVTQILCPEVFRCHAIQFGFNTLRSGKSIIVACLPAALLDDTDAIIRGIAIHFMCERSLTVVERGNQLIIGIDQCSDSRTRHFSLNTSHLDIINTEEIGITRRVEVANGDINLLSSIGRKVSGIFGVGTRAIPLLNHGEIRRIGVARCRYSHSKMFRVGGNARHVGIASHEGDATIGGRSQSRRDDEIVGVEFVHSSHP